ncbi:MAG: response regulator [Taibaiella sp.]|nr:response regulator [Taibaiella sp.]
MDNRTVEILLIEDNMDDAELTIYALKKGNIVNNIVHLTDGVAAIDYLFGRGEYAERNKDDKPKLILLDLKMPKLNGVEVLKAIKSDTATQTIPVVVLTSSKEDPDIKKCYEMGVNSYIVKPVGFENFTLSVARLGMYWLLLNEQHKG